MDQSLSSTEGLRKTTKPQFCVWKVASQLGPLGLQGQLWVGQISETSGLCWNDPQNPL